MQSGSVLTIVLAVFLAAGMVGILLGAAPSLDAAVPPESSGALPAEYVGDWAGSAENISLSFTIYDDGTGTYRFEQGGYTEAFDFTLALDSNSFAVEIPEGNQMGIVSCGGTYAYADGVLTLDVHTQLARGSVFRYTVSCERVPR